MTWLSSLSSSERKIREAFNIKRREMPAGVKDLLMRFGPDPFVAIAQSSRKNAREVLLYGIPAIEKLIGFYGIAPFVEIAKISGPQTRHVYQYALPPDRIKNVEELNSYRQSFIAIAQAGSGNEWIMFQALDAIGDLISDFGIEPFVEIAKASAGNDAWMVFKYGLPAIKDLIRTYGMKPFVAIAQASGRKTGGVFGDGLPAIEGLIQPKLCTYPT